MTRETKIGLVVGLGFIVVFGVLLSQKGAADHVAPSPDGWVRTTDMTSVTSDDELGIGSQSIDSEEAVAARAPKGDAASSVAKSEQDLGDGENEIALPDVAVRDPQSTSSGTAASQKLPERASVEQPPSTTASKQVREIQLARRAPVDTVGDRARGRTEKKAEKDQNGQSKQEPLRIIAVHKVDSGDTLYGLARRYYGTASKDAINIIYEANREVLSDGPNALKPRQELRIRAWAPADRFKPVKSPFSRGEVAARDQGDSPKPAKQATSRNDDEKEAAASGGSKEVLQVASSQMSRSPGKAGWVWYEIGPKETLYHIAAKKLGSSTRWQEIHELNKGRYPDPRRIPAGSRIKLPKSPPV